MQKSLIFIIAASALSVVLVPARAVAFQTSATVESVEQSKADARKAATIAEAANRKAAAAIDLALKTSAKEDAHTAAEHIRTAVADARDAAKQAAEKTEDAYQKAVEANREFALRAKESARNAADSTAEAVDKAEAWFKAAAESDKAAIEKAAVEVRAALQKAETSTRDAVAAGNSAAKASWKKDMAKDGAKK